MLPIEFKEKMLNGTMCAFVSKEVEYQVGDEFYFLEYLKFRKETQDHIPTIITTRFIDDKYLDTVIAKAECWGVVRGVLDINDYFQTYFDTLIGEIGVRDEGANGVNLLKVLGWSDDENGANLAYNYYQSLLGETMQGYLHMFNLIKEDK